MLETYHSNYKIDYFSIKLKVFSRCTTKSFSSFYKNPSFSSSLPLLSPSIHWNCTGRDTFLPSSAFQRCSICVCVAPRLWDVFSVSSSATKMHVRRVAGHGHSAYALIRRREGWWTPVRSTCQLKPPNLTCFVIEERAPQMLIKSAVLGICVCPCNWKWEFASLNVFFHVLINLKDTPVGALRSKFKLTRLSLG